LMKGILFILPCSPRDAVCMWLFEHWMVPSCWHFKIILSDFKECIIYFCIKTEHANVKCYKAHNKE
jgi:hypothetical protein